MAGFTKDAEYMLCAVYADYLRKRSLGISKAEAKSFNGGAKYIHESLMSEWSFEDVDETCRELSRADLAECQFADDITQTLELTDAAIIYMEKRFKRKISEVLNTMSQIKSAIPFF